MITPIEDLVKTGKSSPGTGSCAGDSMETARRRAAKASSLDGNCKASGAHQVLITPVEDLVKTGKPSLGTGSSGSGTAAEEAAASVGFPRSFSCCFAGGGPCAGVAPAKFASAASRHMAALDCCRLLHSSKCWSRASFASHLASCHATLPARLWSAACPHRWVDWPSASCAYRW